MALDIIFDNAYADHLFDGSHKLKHDFDTNGYHIMNPKGIGGPAGKSMVFAEEYAGDDIGAKVNAALADSCHVIISEAADIDTPIVLPADKTLEFLSCAVLTADDDITMIDATVAHRSRIINPLLIGSNNVAHTSNFGILFAVGTVQPKVIGGKIYQTYNGIRYFGIEGYWAYTFVKDTVKQGYIYNATRPTFVGVVIEGCGDNGFQLSYVNDGTFNGLIAKDNSIHGYQIYSGNRNSFHGCKAIDNSTAGANVANGFVFYTNSTRNQLMGCTGRKDSAAQQKYGFEFKVSCDSNEVHGGIWVTNQTDEWLDSGANNYINAKDT